VLLPLLPFDLPRLFRLNGNIFVSFITLLQIWTFLSYISALNLRVYAMFAFGDKCGLISPSIIAAFTP
jgi:hypothetical protein